MNTAILQTKSNVQTNSIVNFFHNMADPTVYTPVQQRFNTLLKHLGVSIYRVAQETGINEVRLRRNLKKQRGIDSDILEKLSQHWPEANMDWVVSGRGAMLRTTEEQNIVSDVQAPYGGTYYGIRVVLSHQSTEYPAHLQDLKWLSNLPISGQEKQQDILYRDFEMGTNHMASPDGIGILPGDIVRGQHVAPELYQQAIASGNVVICVTDTDIHIRMVSSINSRHIVLIALNPLYKPEQIPLEKVLEIWLYTSLNTQRTFNLPNHKKR